MSTILGLDLGTNSIGWAIRDTDALEPNQIIDYGVVIFKKGVGNSKSGEYSMAAERRKNRGKRRLYNAKRYRKWATLRVLSENGMCPISEEELNLWSIGDWKDYEKNKGRIYPTSPDFRAWLAMDEKYFGNNGTIKNRNGEDSYIRKSPYDLRCELIENNNNEDKLRLYKIGRAFYHLVQRRGFQTNRKNGNSGIGIDSDYEKWKENEIKPSVSKYYLEKLSSGERVRGRSSMKREYVLEDDFRQICKTQCLDKINAINTKEKKVVDTLEKALERAIYFVRPLRGQKGLIGKCTLEKGKPRIPISHPFYEEFRALQFVNNLQWRKTNSSEKEEQIPLAIRKKIFEELFFRISKPYFDFEEIIKRFSNDNEYTFNYKNKPSVVACPVIACIKFVFTEQWKDPFLKSENEIGINWDGLNIPFKLSDRTIQRKQEENNTRIGTSKAVLTIKHAVGIEEIWHLAFDHLQTKDTNRETFLEIIKEKFGFSPEKTEEFYKLEKTMQQGYGALSKTAINKINPYLRKGFIYSEAVFYANMKNVLGDEVFNQKRDKIIHAVKNVITYVDSQKEKLTIVNGLIQQDFGQRQSNKAQGLTEKVIAIAETEVAKRLTSYFGENNWNNKSTEKRKEYYDFVFDKYCNYLNGDQKKEEKASASQIAKEIDYYKLPRIDYQIKELLQNDFSADPKKLEKLYHPSDIDVYQKAHYAVDKETGEQKDYKVLGDPMPASKGWKNPMAMRTMHELRKLINYLLTRGEDEENGIVRIDENTRIVVEVARELNTTNMRKAIEDWDSDRDKEHKLFTDRMLEMGGGLSNIDYNKMRIAIEQIDVNEISDPEFKKRYKEFINTFLKKKAKPSQTDNEEIIEDDFEDSEGNRDYDYIMYLILMKDKFNQMLNSKIPDTNKFIRQILTSTKDFNNKRKELKELFLKYILWKEQKFECFFTGKKIMLSDLFDGTKYQLEHTIPRSKSFDSELKNLTIADAAYNNFTKDNSFPTDCPNYSEEMFCRTVNGLEKCSPIKDRVERLIKPKRDELRNRVRSLENAAKKIPDWEAEKKNANIRLRHYLQMELDYWEKKYFTFTVKKEDWKDKFKNSQLVDTQLITKYARAYMKSVFRNVEVQKGVITADFRNIYQLPQKNRDDHSHHAIDAAVLTLIPVSAIREEELKKYYLFEEALEKLNAVNIDDTKLKEKAEVYQRIIFDYQSSEHIPVNYGSFNVSHVLNIKNEILINHVSKDQTFTTAKRYKRKRGKIEPLKDTNNKVIYEKDKDGEIVYLMYKTGMHEGEFILDKNGNKIRKKKRIIISGKSVRGQLHLDSFYGAIKPNQRNDKGFATKVNNEYVVKQKNGEDEIWLVHRKEIDKANLDDMIDVLLKNHIEKQLQNGIKINEATDFNNKKIRHVRCRIKKLTKEKAIYFKTHIFKSKHQHKQQYIAGNAPGSNYVNILYEGINPKNEIIRAYRIISLFEFAELGITNVELLSQNNAYKSVIKGRGKNSAEISIKKIFKVGDKVMMWDKSIEELNHISLEEKTKRVYTIYKFNNSGSDYMFLQHHLEARPDSELGDGDTSFNPKKYQPRLKLGADQFNCLIENIDFKINIDGAIIDNFILNDS